MKPLICFYCWVVAEAKRLVLRLHKGAYWQNLPWWHCSNVSATPLQHWVFLAMFTFQLDNTKVSTNFVTSNFNMYASTSNMYPLLSYKLDFPVIKMLEKHSLIIKNPLSNVLITGESNLDERNGQLIRDFCFQRNNVL